MSGLGPYALFARSPTGGGDGSTRGAGADEERGESSALSPALERLHRLLAEPYGAAAPHNALPTTAPAHPQPPAAASAAGAVSPLLSAEQRQSRGETRPSPLANATNGAWATAKPRRSQRHPHLWYKGQNNARIRVEMLSSWSTCIILLASYAALWLGLLIDSSAWLEHSAVYLAATDCSSAPASQLPETSACTDTAGSHVTWIAYAHGLPPAHSGGFLRVEANFAAPGGESGAVEHDVHFSTVVRAYTARGWEQIYASGQRAMTTTCGGGGGGTGNGAELVLDDSTSAEYCTPIALLDVFFDRPGLARGTSSYEVKITFEDETSGVLATGDGSAYALSHMSPLFSFVLKVVRLLLLVTTTGAIFKWYRDLRSPGPVHRRPEEQQFCRWIPERQTLTFMIFALLLVQNPALVFVEWSPAPEARSGLLLTADLMQGIGQQMLWLTWLILMAGLECYTHPGVLRTARSVVDGYGSISSRPRRLTLPPHHPQSGDVLGFLLKKLLFFAASLVAICVLCCLRYPQMMLGGAWAPIPGRPNALVVVYYVFLIGVVGITMAWVIWFGRATWRTGRALRHAPYVATRFAQLAYRIILIQALLAVISLGMSYLVEIWRIAAALHLHISHGSELRGEQLESELHMESWASVNANPPGKLLFVSVVCYTLLYIFLPPKENQLGGLTHFHTQLEKHVPEARKVLLRYSEAAERHAWPFRHIFAPKAQPPVFCLETAYKLLQVAFETYLDPQGQTTANGLKGRRLNVENLGLKLEGYIYDPESQTYGILVREQRPKRLILAWRGSTSTEAMHSVQSLAQDWFIPLRMSPSDAFAVQEVDQSRFAEVRACCEGFMERAPLLRQALPRVQAAYWQSYARVHRQAVRLLQRALQEEYAPLVTTGHSLGGALAVVSAYNIQEAMSPYLKEPVTVYTFGAPSVGNAAFQMKVDGRVPHHFRVVVDGDLVTMITHGCGLCDPCRTRVRVPQQCGTLVLVDSDSLGNIIVAPTVVETLFRGDNWTNEGPRRNLDPKVSHKMKTYDLCLKRCFNSEDYESIEASRRAFVRV